MSGDPPQDRVQVAPLAPAPSRVRAVLWGLGYSGLLFCMNFVQGIVLVPLFLKRIDIALYGAWLATGNVVGLMTVADPGIGEVMRLRLAAALGARRLADAGQIVGTGLRALAVAVAILFATGLAMSPFLPGILKVSVADLRTLSAAVVLAVVGTASLIFAYGLGNVLEASQRQREVSLASGVALTLSTLATAYLVLYTNAGIVALAVATPIRGGVMIMLLLPACRHALLREGINDLRWSPEEWRELRKTASVMVFARIASTVIQQSDALMTTVLAGPGAVVVLSLSGRARDVLRGLPSLIAHTASPALAHRVGADSASADVEKARAETARLALSVIAVVIAASGTLMAVYIALNRAFVAAWVGAGFFGGSFLTLAIAGSFIALLFRDALCYVVASYGRMRPIAAIISFEAVVRLLLAVPLIHSFGIRGAPVAALTASTLACIPAMRLLVQATGLPSRRVAVVLGRSLGVSGILGGLGYAVSPWVASLHRLGALAVAGAVLGVAASGILFALDPTVRETLAGVARRLSKRGLATPSSNR